MSILRQYPHKHAKQIKKNHTLYTMPVDKKELLTKKITDFKIYKSKSETSHTNPKK